MIECLIRYPRVNWFWLRRTSRKRADADNAKHDGETIAPAELGSTPSSDRLVGKYGRCGAVDESIFSLALTEGRNAASERERKR
jgi:hypothetical protein